ncbi:MAG: Phosphate uptake regulator [Chloroflexi bacterium AL-W]|nr:Phosphate uptake regulator [Chloroflexi bacterium AL-N1]NOK64498.1 Phosphate uptake regulator [Chloroflexi bacterium AL-N10]NOK75740.1 Phosphate uptake regulator [Chloroflexi bacterium AL-N5]NOK80501.1 Phosphate uptake regulator [Chloroflexi bacterium AL-W]NOK87015.1 Phosphate uptake regulator [Chloroflexi bacterium AL-N15]
MFRSHYDRHITHVREAVMRMGQLVDQAIVRASKSLASGDTLMAKWVIDDDVQIDEAERDLEERVMTLLATQQPIVARDLRLMNVTLAIGWELERIGDYASGVARCTGRLSGQSYEHLLGDTISAMSQRSQQMVQTSLESFIQLDIALARSLGDADDQIDEWRRQHTTELMSIAQTNPEHVVVVIELLEVLHFFERMADRATNIGERVIYLVTNTTEAINE